jgi:hypothetical protein
MQCFNDKINSGFLLRAHFFAAPKIGYVAS